MPIGDADSMEAGAMIMQVARQGSYWTALEGDNKAGSCKSRWLLAMRNCQMSYLGGFPNGRCTPRKIMCMGP